MAVTLEEKNGGCPGRPAVGGAEPTNSFIDVEHQSQDMMKAFLLWILQEKIQFYYNNQCISKYNCIV